MVEEIYIEFLIGTAIGVGFTLEFALGVWIGKTLFGK